MTISSETIQNPPSACLWKENPNRLVSLWDMLQIYGTQFFSLGRMIESFYKMASVRWTQPNEEQHRDVIANLTKLRDICSDVHLVVAADVLTRNLQRWALGGPSSMTQQDLTAALAQWNGCFVSELDTKLCFLVLPHRQNYYSTELHVGADTKPLLDSLAGFANAAYDAREAGNCFAFERFTACVYHLMRVAEHGLVCTCASLGIPDDKWTAWDTMINAIYSDLKTAASTKAANWKEREKTYSDLCNWFTTIKNGWRNPVSHTPRVYSESTARGMFSSVQTLFEHLRNVGIKQVPMPTVPISPPV